MKMLPVNSSSTTKSKMGNFSEVSGLLTNIYNNDEFIIKSSLHHCHIHNEWQRKGTNWQVINSSHQPQLSAEFFISRLVNFR